MSEKIKFTHEDKQGASPEAIKLASERIKRIHEQAARDTEAKGPEEIEKILKSVERSSKTSQELKNVHDEQEKPKTAHHGRVGAQLKDQSLKQGLKSIQRHLPAYQRPFSKFIHNPVVESTSDFVGATGARPSGIFVGGLFSLIFSVFIMIVCRYYGYEYNYLIGVAGLAGGFVLGIFLEFLLKSVKR